MRMKIAILTYFVLMFRYKILDWWRHLNRTEIPLQRQPFYNEINDRKLIFIHIPKTAGTSIVRAMRFPPPNPSYGLMKHTSAEQIFEIMGHIEWNNAVKFCVVRNPWDRFFSHYRYQFRTRRLKEKHPNQDFLSWGKFILKRDKLRNFRPQTDWLEVGGSYIHPDLVLRFEELPASFSKIEDLTGKSYRWSHLLKGDHVDYRSEYDEELAGLVHNRYIKDINRFNYTF